MNNNSSRSGLFLMELIVSILFFSLAGAICVKLFVGSHLLSQKSVELNHSLEWCQNTAEIFYGCQGDETVMNEILQGDLSSDEEESTITVYLDHDFHRQMPAPMFYMRPLQKTAPFFPVLFPYGKETLFHLLPLPFMT